MADRLDLVTQRKGAGEGPIGLANQVAHAIRMGQPESRRQFPKRHGRQLPRQPGGEIPAHRAAALPQEAIRGDPIVLGHGRQDRPVIVRRQPTRGGDRVGMPRQRHPSS
ncbi:MAG TPA: hypothetical protein VKA15_22220, partial [Isosphaeraceae bacterium]|nr:hypothetical protein [Isosphaeraceae bacterium]